MSARLVDAERGSHGSHGSARRGSERSFGIVFAVVFAVIGVLPFFTAGYVRIWALTLSGAFALNRTVSPVAILLVYRVPSSWSTPRSPTVVVECGVWGIVHRVLALLRWAPSAIV
jgi:hypothetical protein